jgi:hypothetical protein
MWVIVIFLKESYTNDALYELVNETNSFTERGHMYGYGNATIEY